MKLDELLTGKLKELSKRHGTTLFVTLLAGWAALLARLSGQHDIVIGTPTANRGRRNREAHRVIRQHCCLEDRCSSGASVSELLVRVKEQVLEAQMH